LSAVLTADSIKNFDRYKGELVAVQRAPILGFIGDDYQRFHIHFISVIQNQSNPYEYFVYGKTKVKNVICSFQGTLIVKKAKVYAENERSDSTIKQGYAVCEVLFFEDKKQSSTGFIKGTLKSWFVIDRNNKMKYDAIALAADGFHNNSFVGNWTSYKTGKSKKCHFGDYRIPECMELDVGDGQFMINEKYMKNGWENYKRCAHSTFENYEENCKEEYAEWWK
jgi:hypothetical protein